MLPQAPQRAGDSRSRLPGYPRAFITTCQTRFQRGLLVEPFPSPGSLAGVFAAFQRGALG